MEGCDDCAYRRDEDLMREECEQLHQLNMQLETDVQIMKGELHTLRRVVASTKGCDTDCDSCVDAPCVGAV